MQLIIFGIRNYKDFLTKNWIHIRSIQIMDNFGHNFFHIS